MDISLSNLDAIYRGYNTAFNRGFTSLTPAWNRIATEVPSTTASNSYPFLGDMPGMKEWIGDRHIKTFGAHDYTLKNRKFEQTVKVKADAVRDDQYGVYSPLFEGLGKASASWGDELVFEALRGGFANLCYDGQYFFDTDHPVYNSDGVVTGTVANAQAGASEPWFLLNTRAMLKPLLFQVRERPGKLVRLDNDSDQNVFMRDEFVYGDRARGNAGYGFWLTAFGSKAALTEANLKAARAAMRGYRNERGAPIANEPDLLVVGNQNVDLAEELVKQQRRANGADNMLYKAFDILNTPYVY